ncbi:hypothetical protein GCM10007049_28310 [Echinicola pacifica]|uniref:Uncharacterized protein n=1 Tax=Echinicola pacifica TaxID=346377 RepID=A0A918Q4A3_9BACT|nr:hypothetical protein GCM10007049_28310 [Echinicola pacifica]
MPTSLGGSIVFSREPIQDFFRISVTGYIKIDPQVIILFILQKKGNKHVIYNKYTIGASGFSAWVSGDIQNGKRQ